MLFNGAAFDSVPINGAAGNVSTGKTLTVSSTAGPLMNLGVGKVFSFATTSGPVLKLGVGKVLSIAAALIPSIGKRVSKVLSAAAALVPSILKRMTKSLASASGVAPTMTRRPGKILAAITTASLSLRIGAGKVIFFAATAGPSILKRVIKPLTSYVSATSNTFRCVGKYLVSAITGVPIITSLDRYLRTLLAVQTSIASRTISRGLTMLAASVGGTSIVRSVLKSFVAAQSSSGFIARSVRKTISWGLVATPALFRRLGQKLTATAITLIGGLVQGKAFLKALATAQAASAVLGRNYGKLLTVALMQAAMIQRSSVRILVALTFIAPSRIREIRKSIASPALALLSSMGYGPGKILTAGVYLQATIWAFLGKVLAASIYPMPSFIRAIRWPSGMLASLGSNSLVSKRLSSVFMGTLGTTGMLLSPLRANRQFESAIGSAASLVRQMSGRLTVLLGSTGSANPRAMFDRMLLASSTLGSLLRRLITARLGAVMSSGATLGQVLLAKRQLVSNLTLACDFVRSIGIVRASSLALFQALLNPAMMRRAMNTTLSVVASDKHFQGVLLAGSVAASAYLERQVGKLFSLALDASPILTRLIPRTLTTVQSWILAEWKILKTIPKTVSTGTTGIATFKLGRGKTMAAVLAMTLTFRRVVAFSLVVSFGSAALLVRRITAPMTAAMILAPSLAKGGAYLRGLSASLTLPSLLGVIRTRIVALAVSLALLAGTSRTVGKVMPTSLSLSSSLNRLWAIRMLAVAALDALLVTSWAVRNVIDLARRVFAMARRRTWRP